MRSVLFLMLFVGSFSAYADLPDSAEIILTPVLSLSGGVYEEKKLTKIPKVEMFLEGNFNCSALDANYERYMHKEVYKKPYLEPCTGKDILIPFADFKASITDSGDLKIQMNLEFFKKTIKESEILRLNPKLRIYNALYENTLYNFSKIIIERGQFTGKYVLSHYYYEKIERGNSMLEMPNSKELDPGLSLEREGGLGVNDQSLPKMKDESSSMEIKSKSTAITR